MVDNDGYAVTRAIQGSDEEYNDVTRWDWTALPALFCGGRAVRVDTVAALREALAGAS